VLADLDDDELLIATLVGGNATLLASALMAPRWDLSESRARLISVGGLVGALVGAGIVLITQPEDEKVAVGIPLATSIAGLALGAHMTRDMDAAAGGGGDGQGALINVRDGRWAVGAPEPSLRVERTAAGRSTALYVPLLSARF
jgi:hypothetical protein